MNLYSIQLKRAVEKDLRRVEPTVVDRIFARLQKLQRDPFPRGMTKLMDAENLYRIKVGTYRIVYSVDTEDRILVVHYVRHRRDAYR